MLKAVILDIDGVVLLGLTAIEGANQAIDQLRKKGLKIFFLSNNASRSRKSLCEKLVNAGIEAEESEVYPASLAAADYVAGKYPGAKVYAISTGGLEEELGMKGIQVVRDESADLVVAGFDRTLTYEKIAIAFRAIMKGAKFLATNEDASYPVENGLMPGAAATVGALRFSTGKKPEVIGKPETYMLEMILRENRLKKEEVLVVGDRLDMDIFMANRAGIKSVLVLTGIASGEDAKTSPEAKPDLVLGNLAELPGRIAQFE
ncbi:MAG: HAD-IIA family hydrolase [Candidatus Micrarchaeia archaeon]